MLVPLLLIVITLVVNLWTITKSHGERKHLGVLGVLYLVAIVSGYENFRAGIIADERGLSGCAVNFLGCWGVPIAFIALGIILIYQIMLIVARYSKNKTT